MELGHEQIGLVEGNLAVPIAIDAFKVLADLSNVEGKSEKACQIKPPSRSLDSGFEKLSNDWRINRETCLMQRRTSFLIRNRI